MLYWIKRGSGLLGSTVFFVVLISLLVKPGAIAYPAIVVCFGVALAAGILFWFFGAVVCDIMFKGMIVDVGRIGPEELVDGGILQRLHTMGEQYTPGGSEVPFVNVTPPKAGGPEQKKM